MRDPGVHGSRPPSCCSAVYSLKEKHRPDFLSQSCRHLALADGDCWMFTPGVPAGTAIAVCLDLTITTMAVTTA